MAHSTTPLVSRGSVAAYRTVAALVLGLACMLVTARAATVVGTHGALRVEGTRIVNANGQPVSFAGPSLFWNNHGWGGEKYYNAAVVKHIQETWNATIIRAALGVDVRGGYLSDREGNKRKVTRVVDAAIAEGMYVIVDWHSHHAESHTSEAIAFFTEMARRYGETPNVIYEIYNEPLPTTDWAQTIKPYAEKVIAAIRAVDPDNLIVVGTQSWSQDVHKAAADPILGYRNIVYALHFYAGAHGVGLRNKARRAIAGGLPIMVTEWGAVNADGNGPVAHEETQRWLEFMREHGLTHCMWALNDKREGASMLKSGTKAHAKWTGKELTPSGELARRVISGWDPHRYD